MSLSIIALLASCSTTTTTNNTELDEVSLQSSSTISIYDENDDVDSLLKIDNSSKENEVKEEKKE